MPSQPARPGRQDEQPEVDVVHDTPTEFGQFYPHEDVMAVVPDDATADRVRKALESAGVPSDEISVIPGPAFVNAVSTLREDRTLIDRLMALYKKEIDEVMDRYVDTAREGNVIIVVRAEDEARTDLVARTLAEHNAEMVHHYGEYSIRRLN